MKRRALLKVGTVVMGTTGFSSLLPKWLSGKAMAAEVFEVTKTEEEWRQALTPEQFHVLREKGTERPRSSPLDKEYGKGIFNCAGCDLPLFTSETKFDSGTGWPSFYAPIKEAVDTSTDYLLVLPRTEVHCHRCGGHLGHVFNDGPRPTGKRYCMNGVSLKFVPGESI
ncbi:peptide-methionine (R)-S-oxide reductase MsrB [Acaryochloris sp. 'Moss Beach']|uniref:peptide-methionine (R)-S-oxide reductase MsrB n=1 Tax=Acaryochloris sp. 'Moss Beach' TaxID=2740837 RepID=UPI001F2768A2|nr:peptide-methionine (R)-S-oxide reductase MsrB [Acaryochloris sp. 'Moss Beach']UJB68348.1 peptide-methionine (R)-S-oxide reductase MsrB [Acaryochloris sp. 'Moss Beach']